MSNFINLTSRAINKLHIIEIIKKPNRYEIHMSNNTISGLMLCASGGLNTGRNIIVIYDKDEEDYETITDLIKAS